MQVPFGFEQIEALERERYHHPNAQAQRKVEAVYLKSQGLPHHLICRVTRLCASTLRTYRRDYQAGGLEPRTRLGHPRPQSQLETSARTGVCSSCLEQLGSAPWLNDEPVVAPRDSGTVGQGHRFGDDEIVEEIARGTKSLSVRKTAR